MKKHFFLILSFSFFIALAGSAQNTQMTDAVSGSSNGSQKISYKMNSAIKENTLDQFDIQSIGGTTFTASNTANGTANSFLHNLQINVTLLPTNKTLKSSIQLIFYSTPVNIYQAAYNNDGVIAVFFPMSMYDGIKKSLEESIAAKKKVVVKVVQKTDGYREGTLVL